MTEYVVAQVIIERAFRNKESAEQWMHDVRVLIEHNNKLAKATGNLHIEPHLWKTTKS